MILLLTTTQTLFHSSFDIKFIVLFYSFMMVLYAKTNVSCSNCVTDNVSHVSTDKYCIILIDTLSYRFYIYIYTPYPVISLTHMRIMTMKVLLLLFCLLSTSQSQSIYRCDFEEPCEDFVFDSYWIVENVSSHIDHTYGNLSGHYITYINTSVSTPLTTFRARDWVETTSNLTACLSQWIYSGPGEVYFEMELAQGDDLQARLPVGRIGMNVPDPQWRGGSIEFPYATHFVPFVLYTNITSVLDLDDISVSLCPRTNPIPPTRTVLDCDFDKTLCPELISWSNYSYSWSMIQAGKAQNYTKTAPAVDYSIGDETGLLKNLIINNWNVVFNNFALF